MPTWETQFARLAGDRTPVHRATTYQMGGLHPMFTPSELIDPKTLAKVAGEIWGHYGTPINPGGLFGFNEFILYQLGLLHNFNKKVFGKIDMGKSSGEKILYRRRIAVGFRILVVDPKGEHAVLANGIPGEKPGDPPIARGIPDAKVLRFGKRSGLIINPLDDSMEDGIDPIDVHPEDASRQDRRKELTTRFEFLKSLTLVGLGDEERTKLRVHENNYLWHCLVDTLNHKGTGSRGQVTLPALVERLYNPPPEVVRKMWRTDEALRREPFITVADALSRYTEDGDMAGMFHGETTPGLYEDTRLMVMDCSDIQGEQRAIMATAINHFTSGGRSKANPWTRFHWRLYDEVWDLLSMPGVMESLRRSFKLGRSQGIGNIIIAHHKANLDHSSTSSAVQDFISDSDTTVSYYQDEEELERSAGDLKFDAAKRNIIRHLPARSALFVFGNKLPSIVATQVMDKEERALVETSHLAHGKTDIHRAAKLAKAAA